MSMLRPVPPKSWLFSTNCWHADSAAISNYQNCRLSAAVAPMRCCLTAAWTRCPAAARTRQGGALSEIVTRWSWSSDRAPRCRWHSVIANRTFAAVYLLNERFRFAKISCPCGVVPARWSSRCALTYASSGTHARSCGSSAVDSPSWASACATSVFAALLCFQCLWLGRIRTQYFRRHRFRRTIGL